MPTDRAEVMVADQHDALWSLPTSPDEWERHACEVAGRNLSRGEWAELIPDRPYHRTCPQLPAG